MPSVYLHIPYCRRKCFYCDFYSLGSKNAPWQQFAKAIRNEAETRKEEWYAAKALDAASPDTIYIGGGTPSQMPAEMLGDVIYSIRTTFDISAPAELTIEVNPEDVTEKTSSMLRQAGVNRISMGIQSFSDRELKAIGRSHDATCAIEAYDILRRYFNNISIDLIFGLPYQTLESWKTSILQALSLHPTHFSAYSLMWEERTALYKMLELGKVSESDEELSEEMFRMLTSMTRAAGYEHYEISNYALPGYRSLHNSSYWNGVPYIGLGPGAHSYDGARIRRANPSDIKAYISHFYEQTDTTFYTTERLNDAELREEFIMTRLRTCEGINIADFEKRFGARAAEKLLDKASKHADLFLLTPASISIAEEALMRSDTAIIELM